ncbi:MAG: glycosyltransferase [Gemmataceae bacterium]|nr:glycosyltransferase [Gemmataceae bacterium]MDW8264411.1 glycosyltransferase [Gemmataceae bacterium]
MPPRVSLCMIVKNEEANLLECLECVRGLVDEMVVVDTGSTDRTREVAASLGARVYDFPWIDDFSAARNEGLRHATGDWIFWLDADDRLDTENQARFQRQVETLPDEHVVFMMKCLLSLEGDGGQPIVADHPRLFRRRPDVRWKYRVHEQILPAILQTGGVVRWSDVVIRHAGYQSAAVQQQKRLRNQRLLEREVAENPDDPFLLFHLGWLYQSQQRPAEALPLLLRSLERLHPDDSMVLKLYPVIAQAQVQLGNLTAALATCAAGRRRFPNDAELLFQEALIRMALRDWRGAEVNLVQLLNTPPPNYVTIGVDPGIRGYLARHNLAIVRRELGQAGEAEVLWRQVVAERPDYLPAWMGLCDLWVAQQRWAEIEETARRLEADGPGQELAAVFWARAHLGRREFAAARQRLEPVLARNPRAFWPLLTLSHVLMQEGHDPVAAERALLAVLELDPANPSARHNLALLRRARAPATDLVVSW